MNSSKADTNPFPVKFALLVAAIGAVVGYALAYRLGALAGMVIGPFLVWANHWRVSDIKKAAMADKRQRFEQIFECELPADKSEWPSLQATVTQVLKDLWQAKQAVLEERKNTYKLDPEERRQRQDIPETLTYDAYWSAYHLADEFGFLVSRHGS